MPNKYVNVWKLHKGEAVEERVLNIEDGKFTIDQQYAFPVAAMQDGEESMTIIRMVIPAGTPVEEGYKEVFSSLQVMGYDPAQVCLAMGFPEIFEAVVCKDCKGSMMGCEHCKANLSEKDA